jgi:hypothetical protein
MEFRENFVDEDGEEGKKKESDRLVKSGEVSCHFPSGRGDLIRIE